VIHRPDNNKRTTYGSETDQEQQSISRTLGVTADFDALFEVGRSIVFLSHYLRQASCRTYVLGISGGVDSLTAGLLAQAAVLELRTDGYEAQFIAM
jgi:NAD+ synthase